MYTDERIVLDGKSKLKILLLGKAEQYFAAQPFYQIASRLIIRESWVR